MPPVFARGTIFVLKSVAPIRTYNFNLFYLRHL